MRVVHVPIALTALAAVLLAAGCGGGDGGGETTETKAATTTTPAKTTTTTIVTATLTGAGTIPKGPRAGAGTASITINLRKGTACWTLNVRGIDKPISAHVHQGAPGELGVVVIPLGDRFSRKGCVLSGKPALRQVAKAPGSYYVDVHSEKHLQGALRGRLHAASA